eukprot:CAMPEP_0185606134 /NCGR_PEP_ID=MMETSP0436-20130131/4543_1 /TAXON_ID=626734 ORGANISM="Favella taraikaensis, Strain Fe Narragansett Bay" /NCGR_SAMPLE_ID=MMETSP0436 /ASSEMBLY_ACC=CAM_ASM_000390 /LENGTH=195 /DNA_ID=CAMNT_0028237567 /DNA_START=1817 /DNA_END=2400 /DNA_ORIENTATION=-
MVSRNTAATSRAARYEGGAELQPASATQLAHLWLVLHGFKLTLNVAFVDLHAKLLKLRHELFIVVFFNLHFHLADRCAADASPANAVSLVLISGAVLRRSFVTLGLRTFGFCGSGHLHRLRRVSLLLRGLGELIIKLDGCYLSEIAPVERAAVFVNNLLARFLANWHRSLRRVHLLRLEREVAAVASDAHRQVQG